MAKNVLNLGRFRKRKAEEEKRRKAEQNSIRHGRTKAEREREADERRRLEEHVDGHERDPAD
jgi:hypothetical protein